MKKAIACLTAAAIAATVAPLALTGCSGGSDLRILLLANNSEDAFYKEYFAELEAEKGIKIQYNGYEEGDYYQKLAAEMTTGTVPDIFYIRPNEILQYKNHMASLESYITSQTAVKTNEVFKHALDLYRYNPTTKKLDANGELYAFPKDLSTQQLGYNRNIVEKYKSDIEAAGLKCPWNMDFTTTTYTWDQYRQMCEIISNKASANGVEEYGCDVPDVEILAKSFGDGSIISGDTVTITSEPVKKAIEYQALLCTASGDYKGADDKALPAADYSLATYANFAAGKVAFYGACGSWEVADYDKSFDGNWDVMPWPTVDGSTNWYGLIKSAGFCVSKTSGNSELAMEIAASFMSTKIQDRLVRTKKLSLPITTTFAETYKDSTNDDQYSPKSRSVYIDVVSGDHGFYPAEYSTYNDTWKLDLDNALETMWKQNVLDKSKTSKDAYDAMNLETIQSAMQEKYNAIKDK